MTLLVDEFFTQLAIPDSCQLDKRIFKKLFYDNGQLKAAEKTALSDDIDEIIWRYTLKPETINIPRYINSEREYHEIAIIQVTLKNNKRLKRLAQVIQRTIPYPILLVFTLEDKVLLNIADKRINKADQSKLVIDDLIYTDWLNLNELNDYQHTFIEHFEMKQFSYQDLYDCYQSISNAIINLNCAAITGNYPSETINTDIDRRACLAEIQRIEQQQNELRTALKKESQFNRKMAMNVQIKQLDQHLLNEQQKLQVSHS